MAEPKVWVFFYGSFINRQVLANDVDGLRTQQQGKRNMTIQLRRIEQADLRSLLSWVGTYEEMVQWSGPCSTPRRLPVTRQRGSERKDCCATSSESAGSTGTGKP